VALILEVLDARGEAVWERVRLDVLPLTLGRGYDNDLIFDDPYVDARHARIVLDETGWPVLEDLGSVNGLMSMDGTGRVAQLALRPGIELRIGRTIVRFRDSEQPVPAALRDLPEREAAATHTQGWMNTAWVRIAIAAAVPLASAGYVWLSSYERTGASDGFAAAMGGIVLTAIWAGIWAVTGRIIVHRFRFLAHVAVVSAALLASIAYAAASEWLEFLFPDNLIFAPIAMLAGLALITATIVGHLGFATTMTRQRRWSAGVVTSAVLVLVASAAVLVEGDTFTDVPEFSGQLKPFPSQWLPAGTMTEFDGVAGDLKQQVDQLATDSLRAQ
jgi:hypothetical protein